MSCKVSTGKIGCSYDFRLLEFHVGKFRKFLVEQGRTFGISCPVRKTGLSCGFRHLVFGVGGWYFQEIPIKTGHTLWDVSSCQENWLFPCFEAPAV